MTFKERILSIKQLRRFEKGTINSHLDKPFRDYLDLGVVPTRVYTKSQVSERDKKLLRSKRKIKLK